LTIRAEVCHPYYTDFGMPHTLHFERLTVTEEPFKIIFSSEPYVVLTGAGFSVAADVSQKRGQLRLDKTLLIGAKSLSDALAHRITENNFSLIGVEVIIRKASADKTAKYIVED